MDGLIKNAAAFIYPTDTVWGIGGSIYSKQSYSLIAQIKGSADNKPLSILFGNTEMIFEFFSLPQQMKSQWILDFFKWESTLMVPVKWARKDIPEWVTQNGPYVAFRLQHNSAVLKILKITQTPITTTSLNLAGHPPIFKNDEARSFYEKMKPTYKDLSYFDDLSLSPSGTSSTMIAYDGPESIRIVRRGRFADELERHCQLLPA